MKVYNILTASPNLNSQDKENSQFNSRFQHLVINLDQGPHLKCAPGHDSIKDSNIIKSYWLKNGVVESNKLKSAFRPFLRGPRHKPPTRRKNPGEYSVGGT